MAFHYGVIEARLSEDGLSDGRIKFDKLHIAMPSGRIFRFPEDAVLPSLEIGAEFRNRPEGFTVGLSLPLWHRDGANTIDYGQSAEGQKLIFKVTEHEIRDENSGQNPQPMQLRKLNGALALDAATHSDVEFVPLVKVIRQTDEVSGGLPRSDPLFVPPTLLLNGSSTLLVLVRDLVSQVCATREQLAVQLSTQPLDLRSLQGAQYEHLSRLRCLARSAALLPSLLDDSPSVKGCAGRIQPFEMYLALKDLLAELASLYPARGVMEPLAYDHDNPYPPFADLDRKIRSFLGGISEPRYRRIEFRFEDGFFVGDLTREFFKDATGYYLAVESPLAPAELVRLVEDRDSFKLMPASYGLRAIRGLTLTEERTQPVDLPVRGGQYYYRVNVEKSERIWEHFTKEPQAVVQFDAPNYDKFRFTLYATIPPEGA